MQPQRLLSGQTCRPKLAPTPAYKLVNDLCRRNPGSGVVLVRPGGLALTCILLLFVWLRGAVAQAPPGLAVRAQSDDQKRGTDFDEEGEDEQTLANFTKRDWVGSTPQWWTNVLSPNEFTTFNSAAQPIASTAFSVTGNSDGQLFGSVLHLSWCEKESIPFSVLTGTSRQGAASLLFTPEDWAASGGTFEASYATHPNEDGVCIVLFCAFESSVKCSVTGSDPTFSTIESYVEAKSPICPSGFSPLFPMVNMLTLSSQLSDNFRYACASPGVDGNPTDPSPEIRTYLEDLQSTTTKNDALYSAWTCAECILCRDPSPAPTPPPTATPTASPPSCPAGYEHAPGPEFAYEGGCGDVTIADKEAFACSSGAYTVYSISSFSPLGFWCTWICAYGTFACMPEGSVWPIPQPSSSPTPLPTPTTSAVSFPSRAPTNSPTRGLPSAHHGSVGPNLSWMGSPPALVGFGAAALVIGLATLALFLRWRRRQAQEASQHAAEDAPSLQMKGRAPRATGGGSGTTPLLSRGAPPAV